MSHQLKEQLKKEGIEVIFRKVKLPDSPGVEFERLVRDSGIILPKGSIFSERGIPLPCDIVYESDVAVKMRDGIVIYADVYRPTSIEKVPAIIAWGPLRKKVNNQKRGIGGASPFGMSSLVFPLVSGLEKFEGPDPAYWCNHGYAIVNVDSRGVNNSDGDICEYGLQEGEDGYDLVEWIAAQEWSNGRVGMAGNSWLAISQWFIAAQRPPHLTAIAPWEGFSDLYRDSFVEGGIPDIPFREALLDSFVGHNQAEDIIAMIKKYPLMNAYWEDKAAKLDQIEIPAYVVGTWANFTHSPGTIRAFRRIKSKDKWLRVHNTHEWLDEYLPEGKEDLRRFYDHYLKGIQNGWEQTPRIRLSILDPGGTDEVNRPENEFPLARTQYRKLFLNAKEGKLSYDPVNDESEIRYNANEEEAPFTLRFDQEQELTGYMKLHLWVEAVGSNDMDLFVTIQKLDNIGRRLGHNPFKPYLAPNLLSWPRWYFNSGPIGRLRVSHRRLVSQKSTDSEPYLAHDFEELLGPGQIVPVEIPIRPLSMHWHAGEQLRLTIAGYDKMGPLFHNLPPVPTRNKGHHVVYTGGKYKSFLLVPVIPQ